METLIPVITNRQENQKKEQNELLRRKKKENTKFKIMNKYWYPLEQINGSLHSQDRKTFPYRQVHKKDFVK